MKRIYLIFLIFLCFLINNNFIYSQTTAPKNLPLEDKVFEVLYSLDIVRNQQSWHEPRLGFQTAAGRVWRKLPKGLKLVISAEFVESVLKARYRSSAAVAHPQESSLSFQRDIEDELIRSYVKEALTFLIATSQEMTPIHIKHYLKHRGLMIEADEERLSDSHIERISRDLIEQRRQTYGDSIRGAIAADPDIIESSSSDVSNAHEQVRAVLRSEAFLLERDALWAEARKTRHYINRIHGHLWGSSYIYITLFKIVQILNLRDEWRQQHPEEPLNEKEIVHRLERTYAQVAKRVFLRHQQVATPKTILDWLSQKHFIFSEQTTLSTEDLRILLVSPPPFLSDFEQVDVVFSAYEIVQKRGLDTTSMSLEEAIRQVLLNPESPFTTQDDPVLSLDKIRHILEILRTIPQIQTIQDLVQATYRFRAEVVLMAIARMQLEGRDITFASIREELKRTHIISAQDTESFQAHALQATLAHHAPALGQEKVFTRGITEFLAENRVKLHARSPLTDTLLRILSVIEHQENITRSLRKEGRSPKEIRIALAERILHSLEATGARSADVTSEQVVKFIEVTQRLMIEKGHLSLISREDIEKALQDPCERIFSSGTGMSGA
ncbi:MAG: hypothetical protein HYY62_05835 [Deltaproteobacteria bacterium]|nr:hypothetical protein [Deltaproteobacteria bacterium]